MKFSKKQAALLGIAFLLFFSLPNPVSAALSCSVTADCVYTDVLHLHNLTNAHAELPNGTTYNYSICCRDDAGICTMGNSFGANFLNLSNAANAHVEKPNQTDYAYGAWLSASGATIGCTYPETNGACPSDKICLATISNETNAHIADCTTDPYELTICCKIIYPPPSVEREGGGGGAAISPKCVKDEDCKANQYCYNNICYDYECIQNSDCEKEEYCMGHKCVKLFDLKILQIDSPIEPGEFLDFIYFAKGMADISGDVAFEFWLEKDGRKFASGSDFIFMGDFEEKTESASLFLPSNTPAGNYIFYVKLIFDKYEITTHRSIEVRLEVPLFLNIVVLELPDIAPGLPWNYSVILTSNKDEPMPVLLKRNITKNRKLVWFKESEIILNRSITIVDKIKGLEAGDYQLEWLVRTDNTTTHAKEMFGVGERFRIIPLLSKAFGKSVEITKKIGVVWVVLVMLAGISTILFVFFHKKRKEKEIRRISKEYRLTKEKKLEKLIVPVSEIVEEKYERAEKHRRRKIIKKIEEGFFSIVNVVLYIVKGAGHLSRKIASGTILAVKALIIGSGMIFARLGRYSKIAVVWPVKKSWIISKTLIEGAGHLSRKIASGTIFTVKALVTGTGIVFFKLGKQIKIAVGWVAKVRVLVSWFKFAARAIGGATAMVFVKTGKGIKTAILWTIDKLWLICKAPFKGLAILLKALKEGLLIIFIKLVSFLDAVYSRPIKTILRIKASLRKKKKKKEEKELILKKEERKEKIRERKEKASELRRFIAESIAQGLSKEKIKKMLLEAGWPKEIVEDYVEKVGKWMEKKK